MRIKKLLRLILFEFEDLRLLPGILRDCTTDYLGYLNEASPSIDIIFGHILDNVQSYSFRRIIDVGAGSGIPSIKLREYLSAKYEYNVKLHLTDKYPNILSFQLRSGESVTYSDESVEAGTEFTDTNSFVTFFNSFHHLNESTAEQVIFNAVKNKHIIGIFEQYNLSYLNILKLIYEFFELFIITPKIRPIRFGRFLYTYFIPLVPLINLWDGIVSCIRVYSKDELMEMVVNNHENYDWDIGTIKVDKEEINYLIGVPKGKL